MQKDLIRQVCKMEKILPSPQPAKNVEQSSPPKCPDGVSPRMWEKFMKLKSQRQKISEKSTQKRIRAIQDQVLENVRTAMTTAEEVEALRENQVDISVSPTQPKQRKLEPVGDKESPTEQRKQQPPSSSQKHSERSYPNTLDTRDPQSATEPQGWTEVRQFLGCNDHLKGVERGRHAPKSALEESLDAAVARRDFERADQLSDRLAARELGTRITEAIDAKRAAEQKQKQDALAKAKRRTKLAWGFHEKHRWETKSNM